MPKINAEFAINEGGFAMDVPSGARLFQVQTSEKIPTRAILTAHGTAGHGSLPRPDNPVVRLARAIARVADADQPVRLNTTTRRYFTAISRLNEYSWLAPLLPKLNNEQTADGRGRTRSAAAMPELDAQLHTTVSPTMLSAGMKINVIPNTAQAQLDIRRLPNETREEVLARLRRIINDPAVEVAPAPGTGDARHRTQFAHHGALQKDGRGIPGVVAERRSASVHAARRHRWLVSAAKGHGGLWHSGRSCARTG